MTIFDVILVSCILGGVAIGADIGLGSWGLAGGGIGIILGAAIGYFIGAIPQVLAGRLVFRSLLNSSNQELRDAMETDQHQMYHLILRFLINRGLDIEQYEAKFMRMLISDDYSTRRHGWACITLGFPEVAARIADYSPSDDSEARMRKLGRFQSIGTQLSDDQSNS